MQTANAVCIIFIPKNFRLEIFAFEKKAHDCKIIDIPPNATIAEAATRPKFPPTAESSLQPLVISTIPLEIPFAKFASIPNLQKTNASAKLMGKSILNLVKIFILKVFAQSEKKKRIRMIKVAD